VNKENNTLLVEVLEILYLVEIPHGDYDPPSLLATTIAEGLLKYGLVFGVSYNRVRDSFDFSSDVPFTFHFKDKEVPSNMGKLIGFGSESYTTSQGGPFTLPAPFRRNVSHANMALVYIEGADINVSTNNFVNKSFFVVTDRSQISYEASDNTIVKFFNPPLGKMARIRIKITDVNGNLYDCQNIDHHFEFLMSCAPRYQHKPNWTVRAE
jgi:hypothetical protein